MSASLIGRIDEERHGPHCWERLVEHLQFLWHQILRQLGQAREIAARLVEAGNKTKPAAKLLSKDKARRIAANIAKLPDLLLGS